MQSCRQATQLAGGERVQNTWYNANSLSDPGILLDAVRAAVAADVIVISVYAADELPLDLYVWIEAWLPRRLSRRGALAALVGVAEPLDSPSVRTLEYLQAVARKAQLDFIPQQRKRPAASRRFFHRSDRGTSQPHRAIAPGTPWPSLTMLTAIGD